MLLMFLFSTWFLVDRTFEAECTQVIEKFVSAIKDMTGTAGCANGGEKCLYTVSAQFSYHSYTVNNWACCISRTQSSIM